jgi:hypothetical protein
LGGLFVLEDQFYPAPLLKIDDFSLIVGVGLHEGFGNIVFSEIAGGGVGDHGCQQAHLLIEGEVWIGHRFFDAHVIEADPFDVHPFLRTIQLQFSPILLLDTSIQMVDVILLNPFVVLVIINKRIDLHMVQADSHVQIDEIIGCPKLLRGRTLDDFDCEFLTDEMEDPPSLYRLIPFIIGDSGFEGLDLKFLGTGGGQLDGDILVKGDGKEIGLSGYLFLPVLLQDELFLRVPV